MKRNVFKDITNSPYNFGNVLNANVKRLRSKDIDLEQQIFEPALKKNNICSDRYDDNMNIKIIKKQKNAVNIISSWYLVISRKNKMKKYSNAVKIIERYRYGKKIKRLYKKAIIKQQLLLIKACILKIQQWYRYYKERKKRLNEIKMFLKFQNTIIRFQSHIRGRNVRKRKLLNKYGPLHQQINNNINMNNNQKEISNITVDPLLGISRLSLAIQQIYSNNKTITPLSTPTPEMMKQINEFKIDEDEDENGNENDNVTADIDNCGDDNFFSYKKYSCYNSPAIHQNLHSELIDDDGDNNDDNTTSNTTRYSSIWDEVIDKAIDSNEGIINKSKRICWKHDLYIFIIYSLLFLST